MIGLHAAPLCVALLWGVAGGAAAQSATDRRPDVFRLPPLPQPAFVENMGQWDPDIVAVARAGPVGIVVGRRSIYLQFHGDERPDGFPVHVVQLPLPEAAAGHPPAMDGLSLGRVHWLVEETSRLSGRSAEARAGVVLGEGPDRVQIGLRQAGLELRWSNVVMDHGLAPLAAAGRAVPGAAGRSTWTILGRDVVLAWSAGCGAGQGGVADQDEEIVFGIDWSTFIDGSSVETARDVACTPDGDVAVTGDTISTDFFTTPGAFMTSPASSEHDAWVMRFGLASGEVVSSTLLGGPDMDKGEKIATAPNGHVVVAGVGGEGFPLTAGAYDADYDFLERFVVSLPPDGSSLDWATYLFGSWEGITELHDMQVDPQGNVLFTGFTDAEDFPLTPGAFQSTFAPSGPPAIHSPNDGFLCRLSADGAAVTLGTLYGGSGNFGQFGPLGSDLLRSIAVAPDGTLVVAGTTQSDDLPTTPGSYEPDYELATQVGESHARGVIARFSADGTQLLAATYFGGLGGCALWGVAVGADNRVYVVGRTQSKTFPVTPDAFMTVSPTLPFNFVAEGVFSVFSEDLSTLEYSTLLGSFGDEECTEVRVDGSGVVTLSGWTDGIDFPTTPGALAETPVGTDGLQKTDAFVTRFAPSLGAPFYSSYFGSNGGEGFLFFDMDIGPLGEAAVSVFASGGIAPGQENGPFGPPGDGASGLLGVLSMLPTGVARYGAPTTDGALPVAAGVLAIPSVGNDGFAITMSQAPAFGRGWLVLAPDGLAAPLPAGGAGLWVDPSTGLHLLPIEADAQGWDVERLPLPNDAALEGLTFHLQSFWRKSPPASGWLASNALRVVVQPALP